MEEILDNAVHDESDLFIPVAVAVISCKDASKLQKQFSKEIPLELFGLGHLKRMRKMDNTQVEIILCPYSHYPSIETTIQPIVVSTRELLVAKYPPHTREEFSTWGQLWPVLFRPSELSREQELGLSCDELTDMKRIMQELAIDEQAQETKGRGAVLVDPKTSLIVMTSSLGQRYLESKHGPQVTLHPLYTPTMVCLEGVAAIIRGELEALQGSLSDDHYLCTGLDLYLTVEPDLMSSMALVHSRIRRVIYRHSALEHTMTMMNSKITDDAGQSASASSAVPVPHTGGEGALGSHLRLHTLRALNHKFRVFKMTDK